MPGRCPIQLHRARRKQSLRPCCDTPHAAETRWRRHNRRYARPFQLPGRATPSEQRAPDAPAFQKRRAARSRKCRDRWLHNARRSFESPASPPQRPRVFASRSALRYLTGTTVGAGGVGDEAGGATCVVGTTAGDALPVIGCPPYTLAMIGTISNATILMILISGFTAGPAVSLYGSPTVSPVTAALCASEPLPP